MIILIIYSFILFDYFEKIIILAPPNDNNEETTNTMDDNENFCNCGNLSSEGTVYFVHLIITLIFN